jgi:transcriptional regulator with XRE-family HTH domain
MTGRSPQWSDEDREIIRQLGSSLRSRREAVGLTQSDVAKRAGITQGTVSSMEAGQKAGIALVTAYHVSSALYLPMYRLLPAPRDADRRWLRRLVLIRAGRDPDDGRAIPGFDGE